MSNNRNFGPSPWRLLGEHPNMSLHAFPEIVGFFGSTQNRVKAIVVGYLVVFLFVGVVHHENIALYLASAVRDHAISPIRAALFSV